MNVSLLLQYSGSEDCTLVVDPLYSGLSRKGHSLKGHLSSKDRNTWQQVL